MSHLVPRFVGKRLKEDSPKPFLRDTQRPNRRLQDVPKIRLLCRECEERFSVLEDRFSREIFTPTMDGTLIDELVVSREHRAFCASLAWRALTMTVRRQGQPEVSDYDDGDWAAMEHAEETMRAFLLGTLTHPDDIEHHLFSARSTAETDQVGLNVLLNLTGGIAIRGDGEAPERLYSIVFMNGLLLVTLLRSTAESRSEWRDGSTLMLPGKVWRNHHQQIRDGFFGRLLNGMAQQLIDERAKMSANQSEIVRASMEQLDVASWADTPHGKAVIQDVVNREKRASGEDGMK